MTIPSRDEAQTERSALIERLREHIPTAMRERKQWMLWRLEEVEGRDGLQKVPYYISGRKRQGDLGGEADLAALATFDDALKRLQQAMHFTGIGFAFLEGGGLVGIDLDDMVDPDTGEARRYQLDAVEACASYTEWSPSRNGVHIITAGSCDSFKHDPIGVEVYSGGRYFACTGDHYSGSPDQVQELKPYALAYLRDLVEQSKAAVRAAKEAEAPRPAAAVVPVSPGQAGNDFKRVNEAALQHLDAWVPHVFPKATRKAYGWRVTSKALGRELQEDLQLSAEGIMDFGEEQGMSPIDVLMKWHPGAGTLKDALRMLAGMVGVQIAQRKPALRVVKGAEADERPEPPPPPHDEGSGERKGKPRLSRDRQPINGDKLTALCETFALIYGTDTVYDAGTRMIMTISNMGHAHGSEYVRLWKSTEPSPTRQAGHRWTVMPDNVVFDPEGQHDAERSVNLFGGLVMEPRDGNVDAMLDLVRYLASRSSENPDEADQIMHWLLCWCAYPLQHIGAKLRTAVVMHGDEGAGKNFFFETLVQIYGEYASIVGQDELEDKFNDWRSRKLFVVGDEVSSRAELVHNKNRLKALITSPTVQINPKNLPRREEANHMNVAFLSNENQPLAIDNSDRRYLVLFTPPARDIDYYRQLGKWRREGGVEAWMHYLMHYPLDGFDPYSPAPLTEAKRDLIDLNRKTPERFWLEWSAGDLSLPYWACAIDQAYRAYLKYCTVNGDRFPAQKAVFSRMVLRIADTSKKPLRVKSMRVRFQNGDERTCRMLLPVDPVIGEDQTESNWASDAHKAFELELRRYLHGSRAFDDGEAQP